MYYPSSSSNITSSSEYASLIYSDSTFSTPLSLFDDNLLNNTFASLFFRTEQTTLQDTNPSCTLIKYEYITQKPLFNIVRYISQNLNRFFILPAIILNLCAFYILRRTRMNRSSSIAFYMQALALCDVAFFALRVMFGELSSSTTGKHILTTGLCKFLFLMVNAVNYTTVWLIAAMNADKFIAVCLPLRVSDLLSRKKAYAVVLAVIICSMLVASVHASRTVLKNNAYCWLETSQDEKLVFILDAFFWCFVPFFVISVLNAAIFVALLRARREASCLHEPTSSSTTVAMLRTTINGRAAKTKASTYLKASTNLSAPNQLRSLGTHPSPTTRTRMQSQNLQITIMLITISISFFVLTLPNAIYYLLIFLRVLIESWKAVKCDVNVYRNLDVYVRTSAVMYLISNITSDLMHVVNFFLYFISGARFRTEFRRLIFYQLCRWCSKGKDSTNGKDITRNERSFVGTSGVATVRTLTSLPGGGIKQQSTSNTNCATTIKNTQKPKHDIAHLSLTSNVALDGSVSSVLEDKT
ncbi:unnamed protein product [Rotaria magnacalcarata]|uniref:G-protein coupled receptors family 1 profile domain-containing protein n=3 Tax=Rotaria magnacalcarata TaxID=392030 RepID=A0A816RLU5_9BILA|nr:unnamed protein product [Rotaria magnacalcarata]CAF2074368.1 unnamed protein product [Rotaria magnacalcarata]CAF2104583.1 unnamed protein product [Rotaria magnacalcarata]CAF2219718.1 unnamed protein product [Rotaria magnacalcarata]CAF3988782.1 unnamed protein product [Rotaria magnacalcarata]